MHALGFYEPIPKEWDDDWFELNYGDKDWLKKNALDFDDAKDFCEDEGGHLAYVTNDREKNFMRYQTTFDMQNS